MNLPPYPDKKNTKGHLTDIDGKHRSFTIMDEIMRPQSGYPQKSIHLQKIEFDDTKVVEYRLAYYIIGKKPTVAGKWVFGQYATLLPAEDLAYIFAEAKKKGWINL